MRSFTTSTFARGSKGDVVAVVIRNVEEVPQERGSCGMRRKLITHADCSALGLSHLNIADARPHFHNYSNEIYYVLDGNGILEVDENRIPLKKGTTVLVPPLHVHRAIAANNLEVLVIMAPPAAENDDIEYVERLPGGDE
jgi:mannose-6-phosphate isomerase-like protein (cupin superfamily)